MQTVAETAIFSRQADALFTPTQREEVIALIATSPLAGDEIPGTGGVRKIRVGAQGRGKRGGARVIYYWYNFDAPIYALLVYAKGRKTDLSPEEAKRVADFAVSMKSRERNNRR